MTVHRLSLSLCLDLCAALLALPAAAEDTALLIQLRPDGRYTVWRADGLSLLSDDEIGALEASAKPEGGRNMLTAAGLARAFETPNSVLIRLPAPSPDRALLIDHDGCGGITIWHDRGDVNLTEDELTELVLSALPEGGKNVVLGQHHAKAYTTKIGVVAAIWRPRSRRGRCRLLVYRQPLRLPLGKAFFQPARAVAFLAQFFDRLVGQHAVGAAAVGDDLLLLGQLLEKARQ